MRVHPYDLAVARVRRQLSRRNWPSAEAGRMRDKKNEKLRPTGRPAAFISHVSSPLVYTTPLDKGHAI